MTASEQELQRELERLRSENAELRSGARRSVRLKVSERGGVSLYGIRRFPITFYVEEWRRILAMGDEIRAFLAAHEAELKKKA